MSLYISTHDLARRSTFSKQRFPEESRYFNSRPRKEVDILCYQLFAILLLFQLTTSQGGRLIDLSQTATKQYFNSRPRKEVDIWTGFLKQLKIFQLTTSQGGRPVKRSPVNTRFIFQLTTSQGGRHLGHGFYMHCGREFQLTTSQGGRPATQPASGFDYDISTHDLARRSTFALLLIFHLEFYFNSRPRKEVDTLRYNRLNIQSYFNSRPRKEVDTVALM